VAGLIPNPGRVLRPASSRGSGQDPDQSRRAGGSAARRDGIAGQLSGSRGEHGKQSQQRSVKVGDRIGNTWIVEEGLKPGEQVIVEAPEARAGTVVVPKPYVPRTLAKKDELHRRCPAFTIFIHVQILHQSSHRGDGDLHHHGDRWTGHVVHPPIRAISKNHSPEIFVEAHYVGADARTIEQSVATPSSSS